MIDRATVERIKDAADIVEVVSDYVSLTRRGANYMGLCPFHNERTPSFSVNRARNFCYCFSCHKGGSPVNFIMEKEGISYHDALLQLAKKYGITVEEKELTDEEREKQSLRESMFIANEWALNHFAENLKTEEGETIGLSYLHQRALTPEAINAFRLGYAIDKGTEYTDAAKRKGFDLSILKAVGLVGTSSQGHDYDRFRGRVIFPIMNSSGKVIAFGGRDLKGGVAKYINSPESEIYKKSNELFGIFQAKSAIVKEDRCFLVEGYLDVISMWQSGIKNVVASSGTALTDGQISLIHRFTKNVTLIYDGDAAGIKASLRGIDMLLAHDLDLKVVLLPEGDDPDSLAKKLSPEEFRKFITDNQVDIIKFKAKILLEDSSDDPQKRKTAIQSIVTSLAHIPDKLKRDIYVQECSRMMDLNEQSVMMAVAKERREIVQQEKAKRQRGDIEKKYPVDNNVTSHSDEKATETVYAKKNFEHDSVSNPLFYLEWSIIEYCYKYGFLTLIENEDDIESAEFLTVEYIKEEMDLDEISFSVESFKKIFEEIMAQVVSYREAAGKYKLQIEEKCEEKRKEVFNEIAELGLSMDEIKRREDKLEEDIRLFIEKEKKEFAKNYSVRSFASHEDPLIREYANRAFRQSHQLSKIFTRDGNRVEEEEDRLLQLVLSAINVWKNGILNLELKKNMELLKSLSKQGNPEELAALNSRISAILQARSRMAKDIGERIVSPKQ